MFSYVWFLTKNLNVDTLTSLTNTVCKLLDLFVWIFLYPMSCDQFSYLDCAQGWSLQNETKWPSWSSLHFFLDFKLIHHIINSNRMVPLQQTFIRLPLHWILDLSQCIFIIWRTNIKDLLNSKFPADLITIHDCSACHAIQG